MSVARFGTDKALGYLVGAKLRSNNDTDTFVLG